MRPVALLLALLALAACATYAGSEGWNPVRDRYVAQDTQAILQGMVRAHLENAEAAACSAATPPEPGLHLPCH